MSESQIITSQYVQIDQTPAGVGERIFARILDYMIMILYVIGMIYFIDSSNLDSVLDSDFLILLIVILVIPVVFYSLLWEVFNRGRSPGKAVFGMRVVMRDGSVPTLGSYLLRWMLLILDTWAWIGIVIILLNKNNQRLGDLTAGTIVIKERDYHRIQVSLDEYNYLRRGYRPVFPQAENLSLEQLNAITEVLSRYDNERPRRIAMLSEKVKDFLKISPPVDDETFLKTVTRDFQYYALEEI